MAERTAPENGHREILAVGRLSKMPGSREAEIAVLVGDRYQRQGLGSELVRRLIEVARDQQVEKIVAKVLPENFGMSALANRFGFQLRTSNDPTMLTAVLNLTEAAAAGYHTALCRPPSGRVNGVYPARQEAPANATSLEAPMRKRLTTLN